MWLEASKCTAVCYGDHRESVHGVSDDKGLGRPENKPRAQLLWFTHGST